jgi:hypothetical protein
MVRDAFMIFGHEEKDVIENVGIMKPAGPNRHRWYFVKDLTPQEALVFKIIDKREGQEDCLSVAHSSFVDPEIEGLAEGREGIEVRSHCFFGILDFFVQNGQAARTSLYWSISV